MQLYEALATHFAEWREAGYQHEEFPAIAEILEWVSNPDVPNFRLRKPQLRALETYWYLRLRENTPHIFDLYQSLFPKKKDLLEAFGIAEEAFSRADYDLDTLVESIRNDADFVKEFRLDAVRETILLDYPSYILALAMGAGKTILIGSIFATEFAMAQEYPENGFVENALVFAPGLTIIESLRELAEMKYEAILPPRIYKSFAATLKLTFTRDGDPDIPVTRGSSWNVIVTNTEKIRIQKENIGKGYLGPLFNKEKEDEAKAEVANLRLQTIITLRKVEVPPLVVKRVVRNVQPVEAHRDVPLRLTRPSIDADKGTVIAYTPGEGGKLQVADQITTLYDVDTFDLYTTAQDFARTYRIDPFDILSELQRIYPEGALPVSHYAELAAQIEKQTSQYEIVAETVEVALALVKKDGFEKVVDEQGNETYTAEISYPIDRERLLTHYKEWQKRAGDFGFHYTPYNFDSRPEQNFFENVLSLLKINPQDVEDIYFTGALTDPKKTDFFIEYRGMDGRMHNYTPDFIIRRKDGKCLIVEVKSEKERANEIDGENGAKALATRKWEGLNPDKLKYQMIFTSTDGVGANDMLQAQSFIAQEKKRGS